MAGLLQRHQAEPEAAQRGPRPPPRHAGPPEGQTAGPHRGHHSLRGHRGVPAAPGAAMPDALPRQRRLSGCVAALFPPGAPGLPALSLSEGPG